MKRPTRSASRCVPTAGNPGALVHTQTFFSARQTEHDFNLEKQILVHNATVKINEEYSQKEKNKEIEERM